MKTLLTRLVRALMAAGAAFATASLHADPHITSWYTDLSGKYARVYTNDAMKASGTTQTTWSNTRLTQAVPSYSGVQEIYSSSNWVYIRTTGLGQHTMGPWYNDATRVPLFVNFPVNQKKIVRFPRNPVVGATNVTVQGDGGYFVDGVVMFDARDAVSYINSTGQDGSAPGGGGSTGDGIWNRDAFVNESVTFDPALAHQENTGTYHYHANPIATRFLLGDHVDFNSVTKLYSESTNAPTKHSPIVGWAKDGFPLYGPYGYSSASNSASGVRRMVAGFQLRTNLATTGRTTLPAWAARAGNRSTNLVASEYGPAVSASFPLGRYTEDNEYLGDVGKVLGVDFDLDEHNGRWCVTPEYPNGTYAYFVALTASGQPNYPYNLGRSYYGTPSGGVAQSITEVVTTNFIGGANTALRMATPAVSSSTVTLVWSATEGGTYRVESTTNLSTWKTNASNVAAAGASGTYAMPSSDTPSMFRVIRTALATYDPITNAAAASNGILSVSPTSATRGTTFTLTINLDPAVNPPPQAAPINSVKVGTVTGVNNVHSSPTQVTSSITLGNTPGPQTVSVTFPGPPDNPTATVTYTLANGFTIN